MLGIGSTETACVEIKTIFSLKSGRIPQKTPIPISYRVRTVFHFGIRRRPHHYLHRSHCKRNPEMVHGRYLSTFKGWLSPSSRPSPPSSSSGTPTSDAPCPISPEFQEQPPKLDDSLNCMNELDASPAGLSHEHCNHLSTFRKEAVNSPCDKEGPDLTNQDNYVALGIEDADMYRMISRKLLGGNEGMPGRMHAAPGRRIRAGSQAGSREASLYGSIDSIIMHEKDGKKKKE